MENITYYKISRKVKGKKSSCLYIRFVNKETGERREVSLKTLKKAIGDTKHFMPSSSFEINRMVNKAIEMGVTPFSSIRDNGTTLLAYIKNFWDYDKSEYILTKKEETGKTISRATAKKNLHNLLVHVFESEFNKKDKNGKRVGSYYLPTNITVQKLTKEKIENVKKSMLRAEKLSPKTVKNVLNALNVPLNELVRDGVIPQNPMTRVRPICISQTETNVDALTDKEVEALCLRTLQMMTSHILWNRHGLAILVAAATGMRQAEVLSLRPSKIKPIEGTDYCSVEISTAYNDTDGFKAPKNGRKRFTIIDKRLAELIKVIQSDSQSLIFGRMDGDPSKPMDDGPLRRNFNKIIKNLTDEGLIDQRDDDLKIVFHSLRHYANTEINYRAGQDVANSILGHSGGDVINSRYSHLTERASKIYSEEVKSLLTESVLEAISEYTELLKKEESFKYVSVTYTK